MPEIVLFGIGRIAFAVPPAPRRLRRESFGAKL
jgi:hypothetical protein